MLEHVFDYLMKNIEQNELSIWLMKISETLYAFIVKKLLW